MAESPPSRTRAFLRLLRWAVICLLVLAFLYVIVAIGGAALGFWPLSGR